MQGATGNRGDFFPTGMAALVLALAIVIPMACGRGGTVASRPEDAAGGPPTIEELANASYEGIFDQSFTLVDGRWEGEPFVEGAASRPTAGLVDHFALSGDLDGDGVDDTVALLWEDSGGSGTRSYLAMMTRRDGEVRNLATVLIGDRVQIRTGTIDGNRITLDIVRAGAEDAACCPTEKARVFWILSEGELTLATDEVTGTLSLADLEGTEWVLVELGRDLRVPEDPQVTLRLSEDRVSGKAGCNTYFAGVTELAPGSLAFNGMGATRMACPDEVMDVEARYLKTLAGASRYSFLAGRLVLSCGTDEEPLHLVFARREHPAVIAADDG